MFSSHPDSSKCPSEKEQKNMKQSQMNFEEIRLALLLFLPLLPKHASHSQALPSSFFNLEKDRENRKKAWFIRLRWDCWMEQRQKRLGGRDRRRGHWIRKLKVEYRRECCRIAAMKRERGLVFSRPGRSIFGWTRGWFLVGREHFQKLTKPSKMGICELVFCLVVLFWY